MTRYEIEVKRLKKALYSNVKQLETVIETRRFINTYYDRELNLEFLSRNRFTSKYHLLRLFKRYYGVTPGQYLRDKRIEKSKELLINGLSVTETCFSVGFQSLGSFSTLFKTKTGKSPIEFQKEQLSRSRFDGEC